MTDIVERLRKEAKFIFDQPEGERAMREAADEIERLRELFRLDGKQHAAYVKGIMEQFETRLKAYADEIERLRAALEEAAQVALRFGPHDGRRIAAAIRAGQHPRGAQ